MAEKPKKPVDEDAHFRIDELARELDGLKKIAEALPHGLLAMMGADIDKRVDAAVEKKMAGIKAEEKAEQTRMFAELKTISDAFFKALDREETVERHGTVETPDGVHKMHVIETRKRDK